MTVIIIDLILAYAIGKFAESKGRNFWGWAVASIFFSPILVGLVLALVKNNKQEEELHKRSMEQEQLRDRVAVNEVQVNQRFEKVEHELSQMHERMDKLDGGAQSEGIAATTNSVLTAGSSVSDAVLVCPSCHSEVRPGARFCSNCGAPLKKEGV